MTVRRGFSLMRFLLPAFPRLGLESRRLGPDDKSVFRLAHDAVDDDERRQNFAVHHHRQRQGRAIVTVTSRVIIGFDFVLMLFHPRCCQTNLPQNRGKGGKKRPVAGSVDLATRRASSSSCSTVSLCKWSRYAHLCCSYRSRSSRLSSATQPRRRTSQCSSVSLSSRDVRSAGDRRDQLPSRVPW